MVSYIYWEQNVFQIQIYRIFGGEKEGISSLQSGGGGFVSNYMWKFQSPRWNWRRIEWKNALYIMSSRIEVETVRNKR